MCLMIKKNKNILIFLSIGIVLIVSMFFALNNKKEYHELPKVKLKDTFKNKQFALMLEQKNGEYQESEGELPTEGYVFNESKSDCVDVNGKVIDNTIDYDYENYTITLNTDKTCYCYLYYDIEPNINFLRSKDIDGHLTTELTGGLYRYQGLYTDDVRNYICLGDNCCKTSECSADSNDDMYRIIGINSYGELKVIKKTAFTEALSWHTDYNVDVEWLNSDLFHRLNDYEEGTMYQSNSFYSILTPDLKSLIVKKYWMYGDTNTEDNAIRYIGDKIYAVETGKEETTHGVKSDNAEGYISEPYLWNKSIEAFIGLQYLHDYIYAYPGGSPGENSIASNAWIHLSHNEVNHPTNSHANYFGYEWTMTRAGFSANYYMARYINMAGVIFLNPYKYTFAVRPVFYLSNAIELSGQGSLDDPFVLI